jgi:hypothetical protein
VDGKIYVMGGDFEDYGQMVDEYDPKTNTWNAGTPMISSRIGLSSCTVDGKIFAIDDLLDWFNPGSKRLEIYYE